VVNKVRPNDGLLFNPSSREHLIQSSVSLRPEGINTPTFFRRTPTSDLLILLSPSLITALVSATKDLLTNIFGEPTTRAPLSMDKLSSSPLNPNYARAESRRLQPCPITTF